jgi:hypothetical protein
MTPPFDDRSESRTQRIPVSFASNDRSESGFHDHRESTWSILVIFPPATLSS